MSRTAALYLRLTIDSEETHYELRNLDPDKRVAFPAWRLTREMHWKDETRPPEKISYEVHVDKHGAGCTCGDFVQRKERRREDCKHIAALRAVGLLPKPG